MNVIYNGNFYDQKDPLLFIGNRAIQYGDGLFETIIFQEGEALYLEDHFERLCKGLNTLKINIPDSLSLESLRLQIHSLVKINNLNSARIKLIVWRKEGGLFSPTENGSEFLLISKELNPANLLPRTVDFCRSVSLSFSPVSLFKTCSSLNYVLAGIEMKERGLDDLILLDRDGDVAECLYSNIFWVKNNCYYTPSIDTGCIEGIRRKNIIKKLKKAGIELKIVKSKPEELLEAESVFSTNVAGIYPITKIGDKKFDLFIPDL